MPRRPVPASFLVALCIASMAVAGVPVGAQERNVEGIMDNSFFIEEAYNQEPGVVQHILNGVMTWDDDSGSTARDIAFLFTQEWPLGSQTHQFSYSVPFLNLDDVNGSTSGLGDVFLNYRFQAYFDEATLRAFAPRLSIILPTGDPDRGLGDDSLGVQTNLPYSQAVGDQWFVNGNLGATFLPDSGGAFETDRLLYSAGASGIFAATPDLHFLFEWVGLWNETAVAPGQTERDFDAVFSPGARYAINRPSGSQLVLGAAVPVGMTDSAADFGVFLYLSYEHRFRKAP